MYYKSAEAYKKHIYKENSWMYSQYDAAYRKHLNDYLNQINKILDQEYNGTISIDKAYVEIDQANANLQVLKKDLDNQQCKI